MTPLPPAGWFPDPETGGTTWRWWDGYRWAPTGWGRPAVYDPAAYARDAHRAGTDVEEHRQMAAVGDGRECRELVRGRGRHRHHLPRRRALRPHRSRRNRALLACRRRCAADLSALHPRGLGLLRLVHRVALQRREVRRFAALARGSGPHARCLQPVDPHRELLVAVRSDPRSLSTRPGAPTSRSTGGSATCSCRSSRSARWSSPHSSSRAW